MKIASLSCAVLLVACGKSKTQPAEQGHKDDPVVVKAIDAAKPTAPARPQPNLTTTVDGKAVPMVAAFVYPAYGQLRFVVSSVPLDCAAVTDPGGRMLFEHEVTFDVTAAKVLQADGTFAARTLGNAFSGMNQQATAPTTMTGEPTPGQSVSLTVDFNSASAGTPQQMLVAKGTIDALACAPAPADHEPPPLPPEMPATLEVAGQKRAIRGAKLTHVGDFLDLELTTGGEGCHAPPGTIDGELTAHLTWFGADKPAVGQVQLAGTLIGSGPADQTFDASKITVTPTPIAPGEATLKADILVSGYPVKLNGKVTVVECK